MIQEARIILAAAEYETALLSALSETEPENHSFSPKFEEKMQKLCNKVHRKPTFTALKRVAIIVLISALLAGSLALTSPTVRAAVYDWLTTHFEGIFMFIVGEPSQNVPWEYEITWFPDDYTLKSQEPAPDGHTLVYKCAGKPDIVFTYFYKSQQGSQIMFDEPAIVKNVTVSDLPAEIYIFAKPDHPKAILWNTRWAVYQFLITADVDEETLIKLAESIVLTKDNTHKNPTLPPNR
jgi:hypothetical protein